MRAVLAAIATLLIGVFAGSGVALAKPTATVPTADQLTSALKRALDAQLAVSVPVFGTRTHDIYWVDQDGKWKLSNPSACVIARDAAGTDCTV